MKNLNALVVQVLVSGMIVSNAFAGGSGEEFLSSLPVKRYGIFTIGRRIDYAAKVKWTRVDSNATYVDYIDGVPVEIFVCSDNGVVGSIHVRPVKPMADERKASAIYEKFRRMIVESGAENINCGCTYINEGKEDPRPKHVRWVSPKDVNAEMICDLYHGDDGGWEPFLLVRDSGISCPKQPNRFNRMLKEQEDYEKSFLLPAFLGFRLGEVYETYGEAQKMEKPFFAFDRVRFEGTDAGRLYRIETWHKYDHVKMPDVLSDFTAAVCAMEDEYQINFDVNYNLRDNRCEASFATTNVSIVLKAEVNRKTDEVDSMRLTAQNWHIIYADRGNPKIAKRKMKPIVRSAQQDLLLPTATNQATLCGGILSGSLRARRMLRQQQEAATSSAAREKSAQERVVSAERRVAQLNSVKERAKALSVEARKLYDADIASATNELACAVAELTKMGKVLTPEARSEFERKQKEKTEEKRRKLEAKKEYCELLKYAGFGDEDAVRHAEKVQLGQEGLRLLERRRQLMKVQEEIKHVREVKKPEE